MLILRCTSKVLKEIGLSASAMKDVSECPFPLQEWYANLFYFNRKKCLIFMNASTLFSFVVFGVSRSEIRNLDELFRKGLSKALYEEDFNSEQMKHVLDQLGELVVTKTASRSVLSSMNERVNYYQWAKSRSIVEKDMDDVQIQRQLNHVPMGALKYAYPIECFKALVEGKEFEKVVPGRLPVRTAFVFEATMTQYCEGKEIVREVAVSGKKSLYHLAQVILGAFGFECDHCFGFYGNTDQHPGQLQTEVYEAFVDADVEPTHDDAKGVERTKISTAFKAVGKKMLFVFDYGQDWQFVVELKEKRDTGPKEKLPGILKSIGQAPEQYPVFEG